METEVAGAAVVSERYSEENQLTSIAQNDEENNDIESSIQKPSISLHSCADQSQQPGHAERSADAAFGSPKKSILLEPEVIEEDKND